MNRQRQRKFEPSSSSEEEFVPRNEAPQPRQKYAQSSKRGAQDSAGHPPSNAAPPAPAGRPGSASAAMRARMAAVKNAKPTMAWGPETGSEALPDSTIDTLMSGSSTRQRPAYEP